MSATPQFRAGMVGAGTMCEFHVAAVKVLRGVELVGVCDLNRAKADSQAATWGTTGYGSLAELVAAGANVIHVLTPPLSHAPIALAALELGCHVIIESPIVEDPADAAAIAELAAAKGLIVTVNHSLLYEPQVKHALDVVRAGHLGDIVSVDLLRSSEYPPFAGGTLPPWYRDPGYAFRDLGVQSLYLIQALLGPIEQVNASWQSLGGDPNLAYDEWHAAITCQGGLGQFQLTYNTRPLQSQITIHGSKGVLRVDLLARGQGKKPNTPLEQLVNAFADYAPVAVKKFMRQDVQSHQGLRDFVADFYARLSTGEAPLVEILEAGRVVSFVEQVARAAETDHVERLASFPRHDAVPFLVTGASGSLGRAVVARLRGNGHRVRALVRRLPATPPAPSDTIEYAFGNLGDPEAVERAVRGAEVVIHCGAATKGGWPEHFGGTVIGTQNVIDSCIKHAVRQLVHISSMSVIDWAGSVGKGSVDEDAALEPRADERGAYTRAKLEAEQRVRAAADAGLPCVILRPGQIFGGGIPLINGAVARRAGGRWLVLGDGNLELPLVYLDDVVDSVIAAVDKQLLGGEVIQIIDEAQLTQAEVLELAGGGAKVLRVPRPLIFALGKLSELPLSALGKSSPVALYRLQSALARLHYDSSRASELLGWKPRVGVREGIRRVMG